MTEGGDAGNGVNEYVEAGRVSDRNRLSDADGTDAAVDEEEEIPLPWNSTDESDASDDEEGPETFEDLRFVGPKTAEALESSEIDLSDFVRKRISYRDLTEIGVNPGVAAKIRREHSLSWSFDATDTDLSRRSTQVRGLDDEERAWIAASSTGWGDGDDESDTDEREGDWTADGRTESADADATVDGRRSTDADAVDESTWRERAASASADAGGGKSDDDAASDEETWRSRSVGGDGTDAASDAAPEDEEAAWRAESTGGSERDSNVTDGEAAWRSQSVESDDPTPSARTSQSRNGGTSSEREEAEWRSNATAGDASSPATDAEAEWRAESLPTPVTVLDGVEEADARELADAGIRSVRRLATADPESVADALQLDQSLVEGWVRAADERLDGV
ncbi:Helix-hairpin-helix domain-containing protein [Halopelagius longus]|uniref:Helix-hairpin-helix domain-containing protein n=1 Tax=Halopelagius longus TaxID=1236180 RepID=A0A1H1AUY0_9EURY|nr:Helix-hairpin-helix domain-containing protein [Halopelagius longus]